MTADVENPAINAARRAEAAVRECLVGRKCFLLEAGAGAGKTYSLVEALEYLIAEKSSALRKNGQKIACITYTNAATKVIRERIHGDDLVFVDTIHAFFWSMIKGYQGYLRSCIAKSESESWTEKLATVAVKDQVVEYDLGYRRIDESVIALGHDDVLDFAAKLLGIKKFQIVLNDRYPFILIDEYQDTNEGVMAALGANIFNRADGPVVGLFGDHWQKIYEGTCGRVRHEKVHEIGKGANFRSATSIVAVLNHMRKELQQSVKDTTFLGEARVFHSNGYVGERQSGKGGGHWKDDLPADVAQRYQRSLQAHLRSDGWDFSPQKTKVLMLTHKGLAKEQGYQRIVEILENADYFMKKEDDYIAFFADRLEPACDAFRRREYGAMFLALGTAAPKISSHDEKVRWNTFMNEVNAGREKGTIGDVLGVIGKHGLILLPDALLRRESLAASYVEKEGEEMPKRIKSARALKGVSYQEVVALVTHINGFTPFATKHSVKGDEFENVLVVFGRGWSKYNFDQFLQWEAGAHIPGDKADAYERNRNLFYVACSRPTTRLALLFTQKLESTSLGLLERWFGSKNVIDFTPK